MHLRPVVEDHDVGCVLEAEVVECLQKHIRQLVLKHILEALFLADVPAKKHGEKAKTDSQLINYRNWNVHIRILEMAKRHEKHAKEANYFWLTDRYNL